MNFKALHLFCGIGGGALGFQQAKEEWRGAVGTIETIAGVDCDPEACEDFEVITGAPAFQMDLFSKEQYNMFHSQEPPEDWKEVTPFDIWKITDGATPDIVFTSSPCKGFSGLLGQARAKTAKYQALNQLTVRGVKLICEAYEDDLPSLILFENVPRIATRGKHLLDQIKKLLRSYGYEIAEGTHDCGEIGGLAQHRKRYLLIARNPKKVPSFVYQPPQKKVKAVGEALSELPTPNDPAGGRMHQLPKLQWKTWLRLALISSGGDWRDLENLDYESLCVTTEDGKLPIQSLSTKFKPSTHGTIYRVSRWEEASNTVTGAMRPNNGAICIVDPRVLCKPRSGTYGVLRWDEPAKTIIGAGDIHAGTAAVADPRLPKLNEKGIWVIVAQDGSWHRPLTTYELAMLQGFPTHLYNGKPFELTGNSDQRWRERIGNAVPPVAAKAIGETMLRSLMPAKENEWIMSSEIIWVNPEKNGQGQHILRMAEQC